MAAMKPHGFRRALVIGSEGNIGAPLVSHLRTLDYAVLETDIRPGLRPSYLVADINHPLDLLPAFDWRPEVVFLLASVVGRTTAEQASSLAIATNLGGINNVLQLCKRTESKCVYISTSEVYGPAAESMDEEALPQPANRYGLTKWLAEQLVEYEARTFGLQAVTVRPSMVYDEMEVVGEHRSHGGERRDARTADRGAHHRSLAAEGRGHGEVQARAARRSVTTVLP